jgi:hypothetical protein
MAGLAFVEKEILKEVVPESLSLFQKVKDSPIATELGSVAKGLGDSAFGKLTGGAQVAEAAADVVEKGAKAYREIKGEPIAEINFNNENLNRSADMAMIPQAKKIVSTLNDIKMAPEINTNDASSIKDNITLQNSAGGSQVLSTTFN